MKYLQIHFTAAGEKHEKMSNRKCSKKYEKSIYSRDLLTLMKTEEEMKVYEEEKNDKQIKKNEWMKRTVESKRL